MLIDVLISWIAYIVSWILSNLPAYTGLPTGMVTAIDFFFRQVTNVCSLVPGPCESAPLVIASAIGISFAVVGFHAVSWFFHWRQA